MKLQELQSQIFFLKEKKKEWMKLGHDVDFIDKKIEKLYSEYNDILNEDTSATGGPAGSVVGSSVGSAGVAMANAGIAGMGAVVSPQASSLSGTTMGTNFSDHGGKTGSGDVSVPFPVGGKNPMYQKLPMGKGHGARTGKKSRQKRLSMNQLRDIFSKKQDYTTGAEKSLSTGKKAPKVMNWDSFVKDDMNKVKRNKY